MNEFFQCVNVKNIVALTHFSIDAFLFTHSLIQNSFIQNW